MMMRLLMAGAVIMGHTKTVLGDVDEAVGSVEVGYDAETEYYDEDDDPTEFDLDDIERRLGEAGVDISGEEYVFVDHINSRAYPPINADDNYEFKINGGSIHRRLIGESDDPVNSDKWITVDPSQAVMGCWDADSGHCGVFVHTDAIDDAFDFDIDVSHLDSRRLSAIDSDVVTRECDDNECTYAIDDGISFADTEVMPHFNGDSWHVLVNTDALRRKLGSEKEFDLLDFFNEKEKRESEERQSTSTTRESSIDESDQPRFATKEEQAEQKRMKKLLFGKYWKPVDAGV